jgi:hypothetical protein
MANRVSICSNALVMLGAKTINDFNEATDRARIVSNLWPQVSDWLLRTHPWNCAVKRIQLAPEVAVPVFDYSFQFVIPDDWLRTLQIGELGMPIHFTQEGRKILCDENPLNLVYIARVDEGTWDAALQFAASAAMAAAAAYAITQSASLAEVMYGKLKDILKQARAVDGQDNPPETLGDYRLFMSRFTTSVPSVFR